jgi:glycosyltransferase involved in cell wall biosynthesis
LADRVAAWAIRRADAIRTVGAYTEELVRGAGYRGPVERYTAFGDLELFLADPAIPAPEEPVALFVGALEAPKSVDVLLEAWRLVAARVPGAVLRIAGSGSQQEALERQASLAGLGSSVRFLGAVPPAEVRALLDAARLLVLPSRSEGLGRVILEAFSRGRPVVASDVGGIPELVRSGETGLLVPAEDPERLAKALVELLEAAPERLARMGAAARAEVDARDPALAFEAGIERLARWAR